MDGWVDKKKKSDKVMIRRDRVWYDKIYLSLVKTKEGSSLSSIP